MTPAQLEFTVVERMWSMLPSVRRDYELTQTFTLFSSIIIRVHQSLHARHGSNELLEYIERYLVWLAETPFDVAFSLNGTPRRPLERPSEFDDMSMLKDANGSWSAYEFVAALHRAISECDGRFVLPILHNNSLCAFNFLLRSSVGNQLQDGFHVRLSQAALRSIADQIASTYCGALSSTFNENEMRRAMHLREGI
ncbi:hypothetical protein [Ruegeria arenilitoris]|uniref:hypothetical protein n=1 Tax=Ruegeria arenilitoris TaxID=1173585 RepID=UPI00147D045F|nr:hypothetical protein [Ruegeria arenilitoris]